MDLNTLQKCMLENGLAIRVVPLMTRIVVDIRHKNEFPNGHAEYLDEYKREMWVENRENIHGGQFIAESNCGTNATITFSGKKFYDSIEELVADLKDNSNKS